MNTSEMRLPWDDVLTRRQGASELIRVAREGRLTREVAGAPYKLDLTWVDEAAIALADAAAARDKDLALVYPAPAGQLGLLLAAQVALGCFLKRHEHKQIGLLTGDPAGASRLWSELRLGSVGQRVPLTEVFPLWRATPNGSAPTGGRPFTGLLIGQKAVNWPVSITIVDTLSGPVDGVPSGTVLRLYADPLDAELRRLAAKGHLVWGWSDSLISLWHGELETQARGTIPFSVAHSRLKNMGAGVSVRVVVVGGDDAAAAIERLRSDIGALAAAAGKTPPWHFDLGLRLAWSHAYTLAALPVEPTIYDRFAGVPPRAARATSTFEPEMLAWARSLQPELREGVEMVAADLSEFRRVLDKTEPFKAALQDELSANKSILGVTRTRTAAKAFADTNKWMADGRTAFRRGKAHLSWLGQLNRTDAFPEALLIGAPPRSGWHRIDSGLAARMTVLVIGDAERRRTERGYELVRQARADLASIQRREQVWRALIDDSPPPPPIDVPLEIEPVEIVDRELADPASDPFSPLGAVLRDERPLFTDEGMEDRVARPTEGGWTTLVDAVRVTTSEGVVALGVDDEVDVLTPSGETTIVLASDLSKGMRLVLGREAGRVGLMEALESRLEHRQDVLVARLLIQDFQGRVRAAFTASGSLSSVIASLRALGCDKNYQTIRSWVSRGGPMAPRDFPDLQRLSQALNLGLSPVREREVYGSLMRVRVFRRAAGKALARAASAAVASDRDALVDPETGLSVADLRDAVIVATVQSVIKVDGQVRLADIGRLVQ